MKEIVYHKCFGTDRNEVFWAISTKGSTYTVRSGKMGTKGRSKSKSFASAKEADAEAAKLITEKNKEGFRPAPKFAIPTGKPAKKQTAKRPVAKPRTKKLGIRAEDVINQSVRTPYTPKPVSVTVEIDKHPALIGIASWGADLKKNIEKACFASYQDKEEMIGPESLPSIRRPNQIWKHVSIKSIRIDPCVSKAMVVYVIPEWDPEEHMEWCIKNNKLVYVGQVLSYERQWV